MTEMTHFRRVNVLLRAKPFAVAHKSDYEGFVSQFPKPSPVAALHDGIIGAGRIIMELTDMTKTNRIATACLLASAFAALPLPATADPTGQLGIVSNVKRVRAECPRPDFPAQSVCSPQTSAPRLIHFYPEDEAFEAREAHQHFGTPYRIIRLAADENDHTPPFDYVATVVMDHGNHNLCTGPLTFVVSVQCRYDGITGVVVDKIDEFFNQGGDSSL
jgi:hypothetical protein